MATRLRLIDAFVTFESIDEYKNAEVWEHVYIYNITKSQQDIVGELEAISQAFERGIISCDRLIEILAPPFLKLLRISARSLPQRSHRWMPVRNSCSAGTRG